MKKTFFISLFAYFFISLFVLVPSAFAVGTNAAPNITYYCLGGGGTTIALPYHDPVREGSVGINLVAADGLLVPNSQVYAVVCMPSGSGRVCTSRIPSIDQKLFGTTGLTSSGIFALVGLGQDANGKKATAKGGIQFGASINGLENLTGASPETLSFYAAMITYPMTVSGAGNDGTQKQGSFNFKFLGGGKDCASIGWTHYDPYGVVFDAKSLEPISNAVTTIYDSKHVKLTDSKGLFKNDKVTGPSGIYNYGVEPGVYYMDVTPPAGYVYEDLTLPEKKGILNPNAKKVYEYKDSYGVMCSIYQKDASISEIINTGAERAQGAPDPECRNIALTPLGKPFVSEITGSYEIGRLENGGQSLSGKVTHPLTYIMVKQAGKEIPGPGTNWKADRRAFNTGDYIFNIIPPENQTLPLTIQYIKADFMGNLITSNSPFSGLFALLNDIYQKIFRSDVNAQSTSSEIVVDVVPNYIEGYAYGSNNQIIPNAIVALRIKGANADYFTTTADANGYFTIPSENLPLMEFTIEVISPLTKTRSSYRLHEFAKVNESYFTKNKINLITGTRGGVSVAQKKTLSPFDFGNAQNEAATAGGQTGSTSQSSSSSKSFSQGSTGTTSNQIPSKNKGETPAGVNPLGPAVGMVLILIFLIIVAGGIAAWAIMQKNRQQLPPMY